MLACRRLAALRLLLVVLWLGGHAPALGQPGGAWSVYADGRRLPWPGVGSWPLDSLEAAAADALQYLHRSGYLFARLDSHAVGAADSVRLFASPGPRVAVRCLWLPGVAALDSLDVQEAMRMQPGAALEADSLEADLEDLVEAYVRAGYPFAEASIRDLGIRQGSCLVIEVIEGSVPVLSRVELPGASRTGAAFAARAAGLRPGQRLRGFAPEQIRARLRQTGMFSLVHEPRLAFGADSTAVIQVAVDEISPGAFDLALGYEPADGALSRGRIVGTGHLALRNLFGGGRQVALQLHRPPGNVSRLNLRVSDPFAFGLPVRMSAAFDGLQQDSTYAKRGYSAEIAYRAGEGLELFGTLTREITRPGLAGLVLVGGRQRIASATAAFYGVGARLNRLDRRVNPRRGLVVETNFERGRKRHSHQVARVDTSEVAATERQDRLRTRARLYMQARRRQVAVFGGEAYLLRSDDTDESDLFRFGGATSLRGYDEERFRVPFAARMLAEYRFLPDAISYGAVFFDLGYAAAAGEGRFYPGYGIGFQVGTDVGLINFSLAAATAEPTVVRAHIRLSVGL